jgi:hypothetical protein
MRFTRARNLLVVTTLFFLTLVPGVSAQKDPGNWLRVVTETEYVIEVDRTSLVLEAKGIIHARFRTSLLTQETVPGKPSLSFRFRIDQIQFDLKNIRYRVTETTFLNANSEKVFALAANNDNDWKPMVGEAAFKLRKAALQLAPFGSWNISSYRFPLGGLPSESDPPEIKSLIGSKILILPLEPVNGPTICSVHDFEAFAVNNEDSTRLFGSSLNELKISSDKVQGIRFKCTVPNAGPKEAVMLLLAPNKALILWDGVFLDAERPGNVFLP